MSRVTTAAIWANNAGPSRRAILTLNPKLMLATSTEPASITMLPPSTRDAAPLSIQSAQRTRCGMRSSSGALPPSKPALTLRSAA